MSVGMREFSFLFHYTLCAVRDAFLMKASGSRGWLVCERSASKKSPLVKPTGGDFLLSTYGEFLPDALADSNRKQPNTHL
jgi:hypothetical protein